MLGDNHIDNVYWPKVVPLTDRLFMLIGGSSSAKGFLEFPESIPDTSITFVGSLEAESFVYH